MARSRTTYLGINRSGNPLGDPWSAEDDHQELYNKLDVIARGISTRDSNSGNRVIGSDAQAGMFLSATGDSVRGRVVGASTDADAILIVVDNSGSVLTDKFAFGYDDGSDVFSINPGSSLDGNAFNVDSGDRIGLGTPIPDANSRVTIGQGVAGKRGLYVGMPTDAENTAAAIQVKGYSPAIEWMDKDGIQDWFVGIDDNDLNAFLIGIGYGPGQNVVPIAMRISPTTALINVGSQAAAGSKLQISGATGSASGLRVVGTAVSGAIYDSSSGYLSLGTISNHPIGFITNSILVSLLTLDEGFFMVNAGVAPATNSGYAGIFAYGAGSTCELYGIDGAGFTQLLTPHDYESGEAIYRSTNLYTGRRETVWYERVARVVEECAKALGITHDPLVEVEWAPKEERRDWLTTEEAYRTKRESEIAAWDAATRKAAASKDIVPESTSRPEPYVIEVEPPFFAVHRALEASLKTSMTRVINA